MLAAELKKDFINLIKADKLAHGYLFFGFGRRSLSEGDFALEFSHALANYLENTKWQTAVAPLLDALTIGSGIDEMRAGIHFLWQKPVKSPRKTLIIPAGENLTPEAQNAILKITEESPAHALIILLAKNLEVLLPTLRSRFQKIYFSNQYDQREQNTNSANLAKNFLKTTLAKRKAIIKEIIATEDDKVLADFVAGLISELGRDKIKNWKAIKELLHRWSLINQFNTNKKLQLEAWISYLS